jgi:hypothetical protein
MLFPNSSNFSKSFASIILLHQTPFTPCNINTSRKGYLSEFERGRIIGIHDRGAKKTIISWYCNHPYFIIADTLAKKELRNNRYFFPRSGPPKCYTDTKERLVLRRV